MDVKRVIIGLDELNNSGKEAEGEKYLEKWLGEARAEMDWKSELSIMSELLGQYRRTMNENSARKIIAETEKIIEDRKMRETATGATILLNVATTSKCFGDTEKSIELFEHVEKVYDRTLEHGDYRFAGLHNNMAISYAELGMQEKAEDYFYKALDELEQIENSYCDQAVTYCNLADMTGNEHYLDKAAACLQQAPKDGYYEFTLSKCRGVLGDRIS